MNKPNWSFNLSATFLFKDFLEIQMILISLMVINISPENCPYQRSVEQPIGYDLGALEMIFPWSRRYAHSVLGRTRRGEQVTGFAGELTFGTGDVGRDVTQVR